MKSRLTLLLAWLAPLWKRAYLWFFIKCMMPIFCLICPVDFIDSLWQKRVFIAARFSKGNWHIRVAKHHYSKSPSLRTALVAALRKVRPEPPAKPQPPKI